MNPYSPRLQDPSLADEPGPAWHPVLLWAGVCYWIATLVFLRKEVADAGWLRGRFVFGSLLFLFFYSPTILLWRITRPPAHWSYRLLWWTVGFCATFFVPWTALRILRASGIPLLDERTEYAYLGEFNWFYQLPVLYIGALVTYVLLPIVQSRISARSRLVPSNGHAH